MLLAVLLFCLSLVSTSYSAMVFSDTGSDEVLKTYFNNTRPAGGNNLTLKLFCTNVTPTSSMNAGSFTECAGGGYSTCWSGTGWSSAGVLSNGSWTINTGNDPSDAVYTQGTCTFTGALTTNGTVYGYFIVDADGTLITAENLGAIITPTNNGDNLKITPKIQASYGTPQQ